MIPDEIVDAIKRSWLIAERTKNGQAHERFLYNGVEYKVRIFMDNIDVNHETLLRVEVRRGTRDTPARRV